MKQHLTFIKKKILRPKKWDRVHRCQGPWHLSEKPLLGNPRVKCDHQFSGKTPSFLRTQSHTYVMSISLFWLLNIYIYISLYRSNIFGIFPCITGFSRVSHWVGCTKEEFSSSLYQQTLSWPWRCRQPYVRSWCDYLHDVVPQEGILIHFSFLCSCCSVWIPVFFA